MKYALVLYHKNIAQYPLKWLVQFHASIADQSDKDFVIYELDYSDMPSNWQMFNDRQFNVEHFHVPFKNHADAMNFIYAKAFETCDVVFNTNIDDYYSIARIEQQKEWLEKYDIVSSNYVQVVDGKEGRFENLAAKGLHLLNAGINVVSNPCHAMHKRVFEKQQFDGSLIPYEDLEYWKMAVKNGFSIGIIPQTLHYYRVHGKQIGRSK